MIKQNYRQTKWTPYVVTSPPAKRDITYRNGVSDLHGILLQWSAFLSWSGSTQVLALRYCIVSLTVVH